MPFESKDVPLTMPHRIVLEERATLSVSGVEEVDSFDDTSICLSTCLGDLTVRGEDLHIEQLSLDGGDLKVEGSIQSLSYETAAPRGGLLSRLLR